MTISKRAGDCFRIQGAKGSGIPVKENPSEFRQKYRGGQEYAESPDKIIRKQTLEPLTPYYLKNTEKD